jgi:hypothetical protein
VRPAHQLHQPSKIATDPEITILGFCFGTGAEQASADNDDFLLRVESSARGCARCIASGGQLFDACYNYGREDGPDPGHPAASVTCSVPVWTDSEIVFSGFTGAYGSGDRELGNGQQLTAYVWNPQNGDGPSTCSVTVGGPAQASCPEVGLTLLNKRQVLPCTPQGCASATIVASWAPGQLVTIKLKWLASPSGHDAPVTVPTAARANADGIAVFTFSSPSPQAFYAWVTAVDPTTGAKLTSNTADVWFSPPASYTSPIGALVWTHGGNCTGTVVDSTSGLVVATAAHCVTDASAEGPGAWEFAPAYHFGPPYEPGPEYSPYGIWPVTKIECDCGNSYPGYDFAFFALEPEITAPRYSKWPAGFSRTSTWRRY